MSSVALFHRDTPYPHWEFASNSGDLLRVVPERGGLVTGWRSNGKELIYLDIERFLDPAKSVRGGIPILFPICGGLPGNTLPLPQGNFPLGQHGFARQLPWQLTALEDGQGIALELKDSEPTLKSYPFSFLLRLELRLGAGALEIDTSVHNRSQEPMPFSFGLHPYFNLSNLNNPCFEGLPERCLNHLSMADADTNEEIGQMANGIDLLVRPSGDVRLVDQEAGLALDLQLTAPFNLVVIWTEPPRQMVCLEPWTGPRQALISGDGKLEIASGESCSLATRYAVSTC
ncbi:MAG: galactose mutarotase [Cyanobacteria bacterium]|nr:galactose mutarotase [Cyanobacteriota bacterium]MDA1246912.1 galactose mutarotase [Cyanobacteriota bacterium]